MAAFGVGQTRFLILQQEMDNGVLVVQVAELAGDDGVSERLAAERARAELLGPLAAALFPCGAGRLTGVGGPQELAVGADGAPICSHLSTTPASLVSGAGGVENLTKLKNTVNR